MKKPRYQKIVKANQKMALRELKKKTEGLSPKDYSYRMVVTDKANSYSVDVNIFGV